LLTNLPAAPQAFFVGARTTARASGWCRWP